MVTTPLAPKDALGDVPLVGFFAAGEIARVVCQEQGKPLAEAMGEVGKAADGFRLAASLVTQMRGERVHRSRDARFADARVHEQIAQVRHCFVAALSQRLDGLAPQRRRRPRTPIRSRSSAG